MVHAIHDPDAAEVKEIAEIWHSGWHDAHDRIVPDELVRLRTLDSFVDRTKQHLPNMRVAGGRGAPTGMCITRNDELFQLYVSSEARGTGLAAALLADAERKLRADGVRKAWLACAIGNARAAGFYEKCGWQLVRTETDEMETSKGAFPLEIWRFEKYLET